MVALAVSPATSTLFLATAAGQTLASVDATWRVGSGQTLASKLTELLAKPANGSLAPVTRFAVIDTGGSYTGTRTAYAFLSTLAWSLKRPFVVVQSDVAQPLESLLVDAAHQAPADGLVTPRYEAF